MFEDKIEKFIESCCQLFSLQPNGIISNNVELFQTHFHNQRNTFFASNDCIRMNKLTTFLQTTI